jgi:transposase
VKYVHSFGSEHATKAEAESLFEAAVRGTKKACLIGWMSRSRFTRIPQLGVDEKAFRKRHNFLTLVNDLIRNRVPYETADREQSSMDGFWLTITAEQRASVKAVALDMSDPYLEGGCQEPSDNDPGSTEYPLRALQIRDRIGALTRLEAHSRLFLAERQRRRGQTVQGCRTERAQD